MATYAETRRVAADWVEALETPTHYSLFLASAPGAGLGYIEVAPDSGRPDAFEITGIPAAMPPVRVAQRMARIAIWQHPDVIYWSEVADLPAGRLLRVTRAPQTEGADHVAALVPDPANRWGQRCVGFFRPA